MSAIRPPKVVDLFDGNAYYLLDQTLRQKGEANMLDGDVEDETDKPTSDHEAFVELVSFVELVKIAQSVAAAAVQETTTIGEVCLTKRIEFR